MSYYLMHQDVPVFALELSERGGWIEQVLDEITPAHAPVGVYVNGRFDADHLSKWWRDRALPIGRSYVANGLSLLGVDNPESLLLKCNGLSLSDTYWIKKEEDPRSWKDVNFFQNTFSEDVGNVLFNRRESPVGLQFNTPEGSSNGFLEKKWIIDSADGTRLLLKKGSGSVQQPFNEELCSKILDYLNVPHTPYHLEIHDDVPVSVCPCYCDENTDSVSACWLMSSAKQPIHLSLYQFYGSVCQERQVDIGNNLNQMLTCDFLFLNEDRHQNNFGLLRDANDLHFTGPIPLYDNGSSFGYKRPLSSLSKPFGAESKPFKKTFLEQIKLVSDFRWLNLSRLDDLPDLVNDVFSSDIARDFGVSQRKDGIIRGLQGRTDYLKTYVREFCHSDDRKENDRFEDIAETYHGGNNS